MKLLLVFLAFVELCSSSALPLIPGDNSNYIEGESRYIWIPDGDGVPHLVDLEAPVDEEFLQTRNGANNAYWLFTRENPNNYQLLKNGDAKSILKSNYRGDRPTKIIVHGWRNTGSSELNPTITSAFLAVADVNVIVLDWSRAAGGLYIFSVNAVPDVGRHLANFLQFLFDTAGGDWNNLHLVGHSLGAHIVGVAGRFTPELPDRVTGMDPAGPLWRGNNNALNSNCGVYVEAIHTDGGVLGIMDPMSDADFYPNGGTNPQPGCLLSSCSHERAHEFFASSVRTPNRFVGNLCNNLQQARDVQCTGPTLNMGNSQLGKRGAGLFGLRTGSSWPF